MTTTMDEQNAALRAAVKARLDGTPTESCCDGGKCHTEPSETYSEWTPPAWAQPMRPGSREFLAVLEELKAMHMRKTLDYGVDEDALSNIRSSADVVNMPAWAGCILRISDKMHRLTAYFRRGRVAFDGLSDTLRDIACYAVIAEVLRREEQGA